MKLIKFILLAMLIPSFILAEGGSAYSMIGAGELIHSYSARRMGMGELGIAMFDRDFLGAINPASWAKLNLTRLETAINIQNIKEEGSSVSSYHSQTSFSGALFGVPVEHDLGIAVAGGIIPYSRTDYKIAQTINNGSYSYKTVYEGSGSISKVFIGSSYTLPFGLNVGASFDYYIGKSDYYSTISFIGNSALTNSEFQKVNKTAGIGGSFGLISNDLSGLTGIAGINNVRLGLTGSFAGGFNSDTTYLIYNSTGIDTLSTGKASSQLPSTIGAGLSFIYKDTYLVTLDYLFQPWKDYKSGGVSDSRLRSLHKISTGVEYRNPDVRAYGFWDRMMYRGGLSYEQTQYIVNGQGINQLSVYAGISIPIEYENTLDLAFQYGTRGAVESNLLKENIFKLNASLSFGELWFLRTER
ncbi:MAG: hypothetical protein WCJ01_10000 [Ignavibacteria bacterium]